ncbi:MAG: hypothetical protein R2734_19790 [Nocardioides sp.]
MMRTPKMASLRCRGLQLLASATWCAMAVSGATSSGWASWRSPDLPWAARSGFMVNKISCSSRRSGQRGLLVVETGIGAGSSGLGGAGGGRSLLDVNKSAKKSCWPCRLAPMTSSGSLPTRVWLACL